MTCNHLPGYKCPECRTVSETGYGPAVDETVATLNAEIARLRGEMEHIAKAHQGTKVQLVSARADLAEYARRESINRTSYEESVRHREEQQEEIEQLNRVVEACKAWADHIRARHDDSVIDLLDAILKGEVPR